MCQVKLFFQAFNNYNVAVSHKEMNTTKTAEKKHNIKIIYNLPGTCCVPFMKLHYEHDRMYKDNIIYRVLQMLRHLRPMII